MNCDICGREITGPAFKVRVEGAKLLVCGGCKHLGKPYEDEASVSVHTPAKSRLGTARSTYRKGTELPRDMEELEVADNYSQLILRTRMKLGLSQDELAKRVKERVSIIQKLETGKMAPDTKLCRELEHELKIKLLVPRDESPVTKVPSLAEVTLGDIIRLKGKSKLDRTV